MGFDSSKCTGELKIRVLLSGLISGNSKKNIMQPTCPVYLKVDVEFRNKPKVTIPSFKRTTTLAKDGWATVDVSKIPPGNYYIVVRHINHLAAMTAKAIPLSSSSISVDFTQAGAVWKCSAYSSNPMEKWNGEYQLWPGDLNTDGIIDLHDYSVWLKDNGKKNSCALSTDLNGDNHIDGSDYTVWLLSYNNRAVSHVPGDVKRPTNFSISRVSDVTRDVKLSWEYDGFVDVLYHDGDINDHYVESFPGANVMTNIGGGAWVDKNAP